jgi:hypothetical protein
MRAEHFAPRCQRHIPTTHRTTRPRPTLARHRQPPPSLARLRMTARRPRLLRSIRITFGLWGCLVVIHRWPCDCVRLFLARGRDPLFQFAEASEHLQNDDHTLINETDDLVEVMARPDIQHPACPLGRRRPPFLPPSRGLLNRHPQTFGDDMRDRYARTRILFRILPCGCLPRSVPRRTPTTSEEPLHQVGHVRCGKPESLDIFVRPLQPQDEQVVITIQVLEMVHPNFAHVQPFHCLN